MKKYNLTLKLQKKQGLAAPLTARTLFGAICWGVLELWDEQKLIDLLNQIQEGKGFIISDPMPQGYMFKPLLPISVDDVKAWKRCHFIPWSMQTEISKKRIIEALNKKDVRGNLYDLESVTRNFISENGEATPFVQQCYRPKERELVFTILTDWEERHLCDLFDFISLLGIGAKQSIGYGQISEYTLSPVKRDDFQANFFMALADFYLSKDVSVDGYYQITGFRGRSKSGVIYPSLPMIERGSVFRKDGLNNVESIGQSIRLSSGEVILATAPLQPLFIAEEDL